MSFPLIQLLVLNAVDVSFFTGTSLYHNKAVKCISDIVYLIS